MKRAEELHQVADLYIWLSTRLDSFPDRAQAEQFQSAICDLIDVLFFFSFLLSLLNNPSSLFQILFYSSLTVLFFFCLIKLTKFSKINTTQSDLAQMPSPRQQKKMKKQMKNKFQRKRKHNRRMERSHLRAGRWDKAGDEAGLYDP